jgi:hypothetical protein
MVKPPRSIGTGGVSEINRTSTYIMKTKDVSGALRPYTSRDGEMGCRFTAYLFYRTNILKTAKDCDEGRTAESQGVRHRVLHRIRTQTMRQLRLTKICSI